MFDFESGHPVYIKQSRVSYTVYNSRTAGQIFMIFILLDLSPPRLAEQLLKHRITNEKKKMKKIHFDRLCHLSQSIIVRASTI
jgi:hypothetical protein